MSSQRQGITLPGFRELFPEYLPLGSRSADEARPSAASGPSVSDVQSMLGEAHLPDRHLFPTEHSSQNRSLSFSTSAIASIVPSAPGAGIAGPSNFQASETSAAMHPSPAGPSQPPARENRRYACSKCEKRFARPSSLRTHMNSHDKLKPFKCTFPGCSKTFSVKSNMRRHYTATHPALDADHSNAHPSVASRPMDLNPVNVTNVPTENVASSSPRIGPSFSGPSLDRPPDLA